MGRIKKKTSQNSDNQHNFMIFKKKSLQYALN